MIKQNLSYPSFCTGNESVINSAILFCKIYKLPLIIESTASQVNQYGGYTNKTPRKFSQMIQKMCKKNNYPFSKIILGADHLGPYPWKNYKNKVALKNSKYLLANVLKNNYKKIHIDTSYQLLEDKLFDKNLFFSRSIDLIKKIIKQKKFFFISVGTEVPPPGEEYKKNYKTSLDEFKLESKSYLKFFKSQNFNYTFAMVIEPGMGFNNTKIKTPKIKYLDKFKLYSKQNKFFFEAHSCDYQNIKVLKQLVKKNFKFLKVGPELTYNFSKVIFNMEMIEKKHFNKVSNIKKKIITIMRKNNRYWHEHYPSNISNKELISHKLDRIRYYWNYKNVIKSLKILKQNINTLKKEELFIEIKNLKVLDKNSFNIDNFDLLIFCGLFESLEKFYKACGYKMKFKK